MQYISSYAWSIILWEPQISKKSTSHELKNSLYSALQQCVFRLIQEGFQIVCFSWDWVEICPRNLKDTWQHVVVDWLHDQITISFVGFFAQTKNLSFSKFRISTSFHFLAAKSLFCVVSI